MKLLAKAFILTTLRCSSLLCPYRLYIGSIAARLQCLRYTTSDYTRLANHMPQYYIVSYSISMLMSTRRSPIVPYSTTLPSTKSLDISWSLLFSLWDIFDFLSVDFSIGFFFSMFSVCSHCVSFNSGWLGIVGTESSLIESVDEIVFSALTSE